MKNSNVFTVRVPPEILKQINRYIEDTGVSRSKAILHFLELGLEQPDLRPLTREDLAELPTKNDLIAFSAVLQKQLEEIKERPIEILPAPVVEEEPKKKKWFGLFGG